MDATKAAGGSEASQGRGNGNDAAAVTPPPQTPPSDPPPSSPVTRPSARDGLLALERKLPPEVFPGSLGPEAKSPSAMPTAAAHEDQHRCSDSPISSTVATSSEHAGLTTGVAPQGEEEEPTKKENVASKRDQEGPPTNGASKNVRTRAERRVELAEARQGAADQEYCASDDSALDRRRADGQAGVKDSSAMAMATSPMPVGTKRSMIRATEELDTGPRASRMNSESDEETEVASDQDTVLELGSEHRGKNNANSKSQPPFSEPSVADTPTVGHKSRDGLLEARDVVTAMEGGTIDAMLTSGEKNEKMLQATAPAMAMTYQTVGSSVQTSVANPGGDLKSSVLQPGAMSAGAAAAACHASTRGGTSLRVAAPTPMHTPDTPGAAGLRPPSAYFPRQIDACCDQVKQQGAGRMLEAVAAANDASVVSGVMGIRTNFATAPSVAAPGPTAVQKYRVAGDPQRPYPSGVCVPTSEPVLPGLPAGVLAFQRGHVGSARPLPAASVAPLPTWSHGGFTHTLFQHTVRGALVGYGVPSAINVTHAVTPADMSAASASVAPAQDGKIATQRGLHEEVVAAADSLISKKSTAESCQVDEVLARSSPVAEPPADRKGKRNDSSAGETVAETAIVDATVAISPTPGVNKSTQMSATGTSIVSTADITSTPDYSAASTPSADAPAAGRSVREGGAQGRASSTADADTSAVPNTTAPVGNGRNTSLPPPRAERTPKRATAASPSGALVVTSASNRKTSASPRSGSAAAVPALPRRFSTRLANEQQSQDEIMQGMCMICLEKLSDPAEGSSAKLLGLLDSCSHKYCHACILEWSKVTNKCPQCKARFHTIKAAKELRRGNSSYNSTAITVADKDQTYDFVDVRDVVVLDPGVRCHPDCFLRRSIDARLQRGWEFSVQCERCSSWFHGICVGFYEEQALPDRWFCNGCGGQPYPTSIPSASPASARRASVAGGRGGGRASGRGRVRGRGQQTGGQTSERRAPMLPRPPIPGRGDSCGGRGSGLSSSDGGNVAATMVDAGPASGDSRPPAVASCSAVGSTVASGDAAAAGGASGPSSIVRTAGSAAESVQQHKSTAAPFTPRPASAPQTRPTPPRLRIVVPTAALASASPGVGQTVSRGSPPASTPPAPPQLVTGEASQPSLTSATSATSTMVATATITAKAISQPSAMPSPVSPIDVKSREVGKTSRGRGRRGGKGSSSRGRARGTESPRSAAVDRPATDSPASATGGGPTNCDAPSAEQDARPLVLPETPAPSMLDGLKAFNKTDLCDICGFDTERDNLIVYCGSCNMGVHQTCYGISEVPSGEWYCSPCSAGVHPSTLSCMFCPVKGGALKRCTDGRWGHILCAFWIPECCFIDPRKMEPIGSINSRGQAGGVQQFLPSFRSRNCYICNTNAGCAIRCHTSGCKFHLHPMCGNKSGNIYMEIEANGNGSDGVQLVARCPRHHRAKGGVAGLKTVARTKTTIARSSDPLGIHDMVIKICDPALDEVVVLQGKVTWFDPVRSIYCVVDSSGGPVGSGDESPNRAGVTHWISADKLVEAKAIAFNKRQRSSFIVKMLPTAAELEAQRRAAAATAAAQEAERGGAATGTAQERDGCKLPNVEEAGAVSGQRAKSEDVGGRGQTTKERLGDREAGGSTKDGVGEDPDATESEGEEDENQRSSSSRGRSGQGSPKVASAKSDTREMQEVAPAGQTPLRPQADEAITKEVTPQPQLEVLAEEDAEAPKTQAAAEVGEQRDSITQSGGEEAHARSRQQKIERGTNENVTVAATAARSSPPLRSVFLPLESTTVQAPRYPLRMTRSRSQPESMAPSAKRRRSAPHETPTLTLDGVSAPVAGADIMASHEDAGIAQEAVHSAEAASPAKRPKLAENAVVTPSKMGKPESEVDVEQIAVDDGNSGMAVVDSGGSAIESLPAYDTTREEKVAAGSEPAVAARAPPTGCETAGGSGEHLQQTAEGQAVNGVPPPAFTVQAGWAGIEVFGQVPVMHVRSIRLPGTQASSAARGDTNNATYFSSAFAGVGVTMVEAHSSEQLRRFSFAFEQVERKRKSNKWNTREPRNHGVPAVPELADSVEPTVSGCKRERRMPEHCEDMAGSRDNGESGVAEHAADEHKGGIGGTEEKLRNGIQIAPSSPPDSGAGTTSSRGELENGGIEMVSDGKSDLMSPHPRRRDLDSAVAILSDGADSLSKVDDLGGEPKQTDGNVDDLERTGGSQTTEDARRRGAAVAASGRGVERHHGVDRDLDEDSMEISSISSDAESSEASNRSASDISSDAEDDVSDHDSNKDSGPRVDRISTDWHKRPSAVATFGSSSESNWRENEEGQGAVVSNDSHAESSSESNWRENEGGQGAVISNHAEHPPRPSDLDELGPDDTLDLKKESKGSLSPDASLKSVAAESAHGVATRGVEEPNDMTPLSTTSVGMGTSVPEVEGSNEAASSSTSSAPTGTSVPSIAVPVTTPVATPLDTGFTSSGPPSDPRRPPSDPRRAPSDPRRARNDRRRSAADPRRPKSDQERPSKQNTTSDPDNCDGLNGAWKDLLYGVEDTGRATAFAHHVRPPTPPPPRPPSPPPIDEATLALRGIVREQVENVLRSASQGRAASLVDDADMMLERVSSEIEEELFNRLFYGASERREGERAYKAKYKQLLLSLGNVRNDRLAQSVLAGTTTPADLATKDAVGLIKSLSSNLNVLAMPISGRSRPGPGRGRGKGKGAKGARRGMMFLA